MADFSWCEWVESILVFLCCWLLSVFDSHLPKKEKNCFLFSVLKIAVKLSFYLAANTQCMTEVALT